jgi:ankyrin repeat protein
VDASTDKGGTPLHSAAQHGHAAVVTALVELGADSGVAGSLLLGLPATPLPAPSPSSRLALWTTVERNLCSSASATVTIMWRGC